MEFTTILYFVIMIWGLGYSLTYIFRLKDYAKGLEKFAMDIGFGLGLFPILAIIINTLFIPLKWYIFLVLAMIIPALQAYRYITSFDKDKVPKFSYKFKKSHLALLIVFIIFGIHLFVFVKGAFIFPYLENGDPWAHADTSQYIAEYGTYKLEKSEWPPESNWNILHYTEPYPPGFAILNAMLYQIDSDMKSILKFFNALIISLGILFCYFFMARLMKSRTKAVFAAFALAVVPCYLSHFIFAASLAVTLFWVGFYALYMMRESSAWRYIAAIVAASIFVTQPITAGIFAMILGVYWLAGVVLEKNLQYNTLIAAILGLTLSQVFYVQTLLKFGYNTFATKLGFGMMVGGAGDSSGGVIYSFNDYLISPLANKIDQATGFGPFFFIALLTVLAFFFIISKRIFYSEDKERSKWITTAMMLFILSFIATQSNRFAYKFFPHRVWVYMAIAAVILLSIGIFLLLESFRLPKTAIYLIIGILVIGMIFTSALPKYKVQTSMWPADYGHFPLAQNEDGGIYSPELNGYLWLEKNIPEKIDVLVICDPTDQFAAGVNHGSKSELLIVREFKDRIKEADGPAVYRLMDNVGYDLVTIGRSCINKGILEIEELNALLMSIGETEGFTPIYTDANGMFIFAKE